jgi:pantothenate kinase-related protein Tda10
MMNFNLDRDFTIFNELLQRRPEIFAENLKKDLERYYLPYSEKLITLKKEKSPNRGLLVGISAIQGAGKTTQGEILEVLLTHLGFSSISRSIDDHYITHAELCELRQEDPRFIRRGVTHDIPLAMEELLSLQEMEEGKPVLVSGYDKGAHYGDGDRLRFIEPEDGLVLKVGVLEAEIVADKKLQILPVLDLKTASFKGAALELPEDMGAKIPLAEHTVSNKLKTYLESLQGQELTITCSGEEIIFKGQAEGRFAKSDLPVGWRLVIKKPDFIFYDGWMLGAKKVADESVFDQNLPALETEESKKFAKDVNKKLAEYDSLWEMFDFLNVLYVPNYQVSIKWRNQAEEILRAKGEGMSSEQIT